MKKYNFIAMAITVLACALSITSCQDEDIDTLGAKYLDEDSGIIKPALESSESAEIRTMAEKSATEYTKDWWKYMMSFNCTNNPLNGAPALTTAEGQSGGPVVFLAGSRGGSAVRNVEISKNQALLVPVINILNDYPCRDASFRPASTQSVEQFLKEHADRFIDKATAMRVTLDGKPIKITKEHRASTDLFYFTGNPDLVNCLDYCVTGQSQAAVSDGYWLIIRSLLRGRHVLTVHAEIPDYDIVLHTTYDIIVR